MPYSRLQLFILKISLMFFIFNFNFEHVHGKKSWKFKSIKKLSKSEVEVKTYVLPCSVDEKRILNITFGSGYKHLHNCRRKLVIKMTIHSGREFYSKSDGFIPIDHVTDGLTGRKKRLLNPLMVRLKRERMFQLYDLRLVQAINAEAREEVITYENTPDFTGCDTTSSHPTCGFSYQDNKIIQYSEGFCCSCDQIKNDQRQPCENRSFDAENSPKLSRSACHRNRSSRGLGTMESGLEESADRRGGLRKEYGNSKASILSASQSQPWLKEEVREEGNNTLESHHGSGVFENSNDGVINDQSFPGNEFDSGGSVFDVIRNLTDKTFQDDHTLVPDVIKSQMSKPRCGNEVEVNVTEEEQTTGGGICSTDSLTDVNNTLTKEKLRLLLMHKIKVEKYNEKIMSTTTCTAPENSGNCDEVKSLYCTQGKSLNILQELPKNVQRELFSLNLENNDSERRIEIVTKRPNEDLIISNKNTSVPLVPLESNSTSTNKKSVNSSFNNFMKLFKPKHFTQCVADPHSDVDNSRKRNKVNVYNDTDSIKSIERIAYKLVPIINAPILNSEYNIWDNAQVKLNTVGNISQQFTLELQNNLNIDGFQTATTLSLGKKQKEMNSIGNEPLQYSSLEDSTQKYLVESNEPGLKIDRTKVIEKRDVCDRQTRGGQSCSREDAQLPCNADPITYFESAHCLRFSELWYNVHTFENPRVENSITLKIYGKHSKNDKRTCWENLTKRLSGRVGTANKMLTDDNKNRSIMIFYSSKDKVAYSLDSSSDVLLVPQPLPKKSKDSELKAVSSGGPGEYLVLKDSEISVNGDECDRAGVNYAAFSRQLHRCQQEAGTCLKNQPLQFWRDDKKATAEGKPGQHFLNSFILVNDQTIMQDVSSGQVVVRAPYYEHYKSDVVVELKADHIDIIGDKSEGQITEVYIDATSKKVSTIKVVVTNMGIAVDYFGVTFANCSYSLGPSDFDKPGRDEIPPQHRITYTATISTPLSHRRVDCNIVLYNMDEEMIAKRHITIMRGERCMCVWHCQCVCYDYPQPSLLCTPLRPKDYNQAGFVGQLPVRSRSNCSTLFLVIQGLLWFFIFLLLLGLMKAVVGLLITYVAMWGLWYMVPGEALSLNCYMEPHLCTYPLVRDSENFPVHPFTHTRTVHFLPWYSEFIINIFFFICFARMCLCDKVLRKANCMPIHNNYYYDCDGRFYARQRTRHHHMSPGYFNRCGPSSPSHSMCSNRRRCRLAAGGGSPYDTDPLVLLKDEEEARHFVQELVRSYVVFRKFTMPVGGVQSVPGTPYFVRGFFMESENGVYHFRPPSPLIQIWTMDHTPLDPPVVLDSAPFHAVYRGVSEVMAAQELTPWGHGVVINEP